MACNKTYGQEYFLFSGYFEQYSNRHKAVVFHDWHQKSDLTEENLRNVRPVPFTPVMVNGLADNAADEDKQFWGTNAIGKLMNLSLAKPIDELLVKAEQGTDACSPSEVSSPENNEDEVVVLHQNSRVTKLNKPEYELSFLSLKLLANMLNGQEQGPAQLANQFKELAQIVDDRLKGVTFSVTQILPEQLAPAYEEEIGEPLTEQQKEYNNWLKQCQATPKTPIKGFMVPAMHTCAVVFSDPMYAGAEVSLIKPLTKIDIKDINKTEEVIAVTEVTLPKFDDQDKENGEKAQLLPCALFHLDPSQADDGFYLLRIKFWQTDYEAKGIVLPNAVKESSLKKEHIFRREADKAPQNVYTYELHEKVQFQSAGGLGKIAYVCGDMISLEECLIHQFPNTLPSYDDFVRNGVGHKASSEPGVGAISLVATSTKTYESITEDFISKDGLKLSGTPSEMAQTIGKTFWDSIDSGLIPEPVTAALSFGYALSARKEAVKQFNWAMRLKRRNLSLEQSLGLFFKHKVVDTAYFKRIYKLGPELPLAKKLQRVAGRAAKSWGGGALMKRLPAIATVEDLVSFYNAYDDYGKLTNSADGAYKNLVELSEDYLKQLTFVKQHDTKAWEEKAKEVKEHLGEDARILIDKRGVAVHLNFQFNSATVTNQMKALKSDFSALCAKLCTMLKNNPDYQILAEGHAGQMGTSEANVTVSKRRVNFVKEEVLKNAVSKEEREALGTRIHSSFYGKSQPLENPENYEDKKDKSDSSDLAPDRRVEIRLVIPDYSVRLPPSRTGMLKLESQHQLWQSFSLDAEHAEDEMMQSMIGALCGVALYTPLAPIASLYFFGEVGKQVLDTALELFDELYMEDAYTRVKKRFANKNRVNELGRINKDILEQYIDINKEIEAKFSTIDELKEHLSSQVTSKELLKRYLLRAYALNSLVELLARISLSTWLKDRTELLEKYRVGLFIEKYIMNDNWEIPRTSYNTLAVNWINQTDHKKHNYYYDSSYHYGHNKKISGAFSTGFPVQTALYLNKAENMLEQFSKDFSMNEEFVVIEDVGFSRILIFCDESNAWVTYPKWLEKESTSTKPHACKVGPFTRIKLQLILTKEASKSKKSMFNVMVSYCVSKFFDDIEGPNFSVLMTSLKASDFDDPDGVVSDYFEQQEAKDEELAGLEFEPTYWFGAFEIPGIKPLYSTELYHWTKGKLSDKSAFEQWVEDNEHQSLKYYLKVNDVELSLSYPWGSEGLTRGVPKDKKYLSYGVFDRTQKSNLFDGQFMKSAQLSGKDLLVEEFVESTSVEKSANTPRVIDNGLVVQAALKIDSELKFFDQWDEKALKKSFDWKKEKEMAIYVAILGDDLATETYEKMGLDVNCVPMILQLLGQDNISGPVLLADMHSQGSVKVEFSSDMVPEENSYRDLKEERKYALTFNPEESTCVNKVLGGELIDFSKKAVSYIEKHGDKLMDDSTKPGEKCIYAMKFILHYVSPTGRKVSGLRPFGDIVESKSLAKSKLSIGALAQQGIDDKYKISPKPLSLPGVDNYSEGVPWVIEDEAGKEYNKSASTYWSSISVEKRKEWIETWIKDKTTILSAPEAHLID